MSDLLSLLSLGSAGIAAQNSGISVASNNVANANTAGYSRQRVDLEALVGMPLVGGVRAGSPDRYQDAILGGRIRNAGSTLAMSQASANILGDLEARLVDGGATLNESLADVFASFTRASSSPTDTVSRRDVLAKLQQFVDDVHRRCENLDAAQVELDASIAAHAKQASDLAQHLAETNLAIGKTNDPVMRDERDRTAEQLSKLVGGSARIDADGQMRFVLDGGAVLVDGSRAAKLDVTPEPTTGKALIAVVDGGSRRDVTKVISGGALGAELQTRDGTLANARTALDQLAYDVATNMNGVHAANAGLDGVTGRMLFSPPTGVAGAAKAFALDATVADDPTMLALGAAGQGPGSNAGAVAMTQLANATVATGGKSLGNAAIDLVGDVGRAASRAQADVKRDQIVSDHLAGLRDSLAGVDIQEEMTNLARFEHASAAMTRFVSTIDGLLGDLIDRL
jgi:flagellar hook-associated protein 1 FlgK